MCGIEILRYAEGHIATLATVPIILVLWAADRGRRCHRKGQAPQIAKLTWIWNYQCFVILHSYVREGQAPHPKI